MGCIWIFLWSYKFWFWMANFDHLNINKANATFDFKIDSDFSFTLWMSHAKAALTYSGNFSFCLLVLIRFICSILLVWFESKINQHISSLNQKPIVAHPSMLTCFLLNLDKVFSQLSLTWLFELTNLCW